MPAAEYYADLQAQVDEGHRPGLLDPVQAAMDWYRTKYDAEDLSGIAFTLLENHGSFLPVQVRNTVFTYAGQEYDLSERNGTINAITDWTLVGKYLVFEGHTGPQNNIYCIFDTESKSFEPDLAGANLIFHGDDIATGIYSFWSNVYAYDGTLLGSYELEESEFIYELRYSEDASQVEVDIVSDIGDQRTEYIDLTA